MGASSLLESQSATLVLLLLFLLVILVSIFIYFRLKNSYKLKLHQQSEKLKEVELQYAEIVMHQRHLLEKEQRLLGELSEYKYSNVRLNDSLHQAERALDVALSEVQQKERNIQEKRQQLDILQLKYEEKIEQLNNLNTAYTQLKTEQEERQNSYQKQLSQFEEQKKSLTEQFKLLANDILETKAKALQETNQHSLTSVMSPFKESIDSFKKEVQEIHHRETTQQGELRKELETLKELNQKITMEAHELSTALKGQKKLQGNWGELVLENVLDRSGLQIGKDYKREVSITTEEGRQRPDAVIYLPQNKHLIIDAKVSLNAYTRYINSEDETERKQALAEHVMVMGQRINELAKRDYYKLPGLNSPEIVFMFVPIESAFVEALKADETLFQKAIENNVLVATPITLLTSLNIVRQLWRYEDQNKHTVALATKAEAVFKKLNSFLASFENIKKGLDKANEAYIKSEGQLISGKGNLVKQVGEFKNLAPAIKAELPSYFTEKAELEIDYIAAQKIDVPEESANPLTEQDKI
jgi:DNA recombination protein RmuC